MLKQLVETIRDDEEEDFDNKPNSDEDCFITDNTRSGYDVSCGGKFLGNFKEMDDALKGVKDWKKKHNYYPTTWWVSDHGNMWPIDDKGKEIKESISESEIDPIIQKIGDAIKESGKSLVSLRPVLEKMFPKKSIDSSMEPFFYFKIDHKGKKIILTNKKNVDDAELVVGEIAIGFIG